MSIKGHCNHVLETRERVRDLYGTSAQALRLFTHDDPADYNMLQTLIDSSGPSRCRKIKGLSRKVKKTLLHNDRTILLQH